MVSLCVPVDTTRLTLLKLVYAAKLPYTASSIAPAKRKIAAALLCLIHFPFLNSIFLTFLCNRSHAQKASKAFISLDFLMFLTWYHGITLTTYFQGFKIKNKKKKGVQKTSNFPHAIIFNYSSSTKTNTFCLGIILRSVSRSFDYLIYPYYPAYTN